MYICTKVSLNKAPSHLGGVCEKLLGHRPCIVNILGGGGFSFFMQGS